MRKEKPKNQLFTVQNRTLEKPFYVEYSEFLNDRIKMNVQVSKDYNMTGKFRECIYPFIAEIYSRIASEFYLDKNPAMKNLIYTFSDSVQLYMINTFRYYFDLQVIYNTIDEDIRRFNHVTIRDVDDDILLKNIYKYTIPLIDLYTYECVLYITNALSESLYCIFICELNSSDFKVVGSVIADIINDFIPILKNTVMDIVKDYFRFKEVLFE